MTPKEELYVLFLLASLFPAVFYHKGLLYGIVLSAILQYIAVYRYIKSVKKTNNLIDVFFSFTGLFALGIALGTCAMGVVTKGGKGLVYGAGISTVVQALAVKMADEMANN